VTRAGNSTAQPLTSAQALLEVGQTLPVKRYRPTALSFVKLPPNMHLFEVTAYLREVQKWPQHNYGMFRWNIKNIITQPYTTNSCPILLSSLYQ
jgi:hypothetical protein